jgi:competence protein ComGG
MKNNEKGFTYPLTLCLVILFLSFFSLRIEQILSVRKMAHETDIILQEEYYFQSSAKKVEVIFQTSGSLPSKGTFSFFKGTMNYQADPPSGTIQKVNFTLFLHAGDKTYIGRGYFDTRNKRLTKWIELK